MAPHRSHPRRAARDTKTPGSLVPTLAGRPPAPGPSVGDESLQQLGRFRILARLGAGVFGTVYRARDPQLDRDVALKVPRAETLGNPQAVERFLREAKAAARLRHPHLVPIYDAGREGTHYYIASAFIEGQTLAHAIDEGGIDFRRATQIVRDLAEALAYAHRLGIVHRDVKPFNVMLDAKDKPYLMDFGLAHRHDVAQRLTQEGDVIGTPAYMAPEQARDSGDPLPASDQYSLGIVLYELLCGERPFSGPPPVVMFNHLHQEPPSPRSVKRDLPLDLETVCLKALAKRPEDRYASCQELADDLRRWLDDKPIRARRVNMVERVVRWFQREPRVAWTVTGAAVCLLALVVVLTVSAISLGHG